MGSLKRKNRRGRPRRRLSRHKKSITYITAILMFMSAVVFVHGISLQESNGTYMEQEEELVAQINAEKERSKEIDDLEEYVETEEYIEQVAREKLALIYPNEILFRSMQ